MATVLFRIPSHRKVVNTVIIRLPSQGKNSKSPPNEVHPNISEKEDRVLKDLVAKFLVTSSFCNLLALLSINS